MDRVMDTSSRGSPDDPDRMGDLGAREIRTCRVCGASSQLRERMAYRLRRTYTKGHK